MTQKHCFCRSLVTHKMYETMIVHKIKHCIRNNKLKIGAKYMTQIIRKY